MPANANPDGMGSFSKDYGFYNAQKN